MRGHAAPVISPLPGSKYKPTLAKAIVDKMHSEIQVALKFVISFLYNKLPRRRVNLFGEELENALRDKFQGHWSPDKPFKGSAYRCLKITDPADPVLNRAARESGNPITDIIENLPADLAVWIDPGEVSYRMGEKGAVKILFSEKEVQQGNPAVDDLSPEVRSFLTLDTVTNSLNGISLSSGKSSTAISPKPYLFKFLQPKPNLRMPSISFVLQLDINSIRETSSRHLFPVIVSFARSSSVHSV